MVLGYNGIAYWSAYRIDGDRMIDPSQGIPVMLIDLSDWHRLPEVDDYAQRRGLSRWEAIHELVNWALDERAKLRHYAPDLP